MADSTAFANVGRVSVAFWRCRCELVGLWWIEVQPPKQPMDLWTERAGRSSGKVRPTTTSAGFGVVELFVRGYGERTQENGMKMDVGDEQIYRLRDYAPSERVRIVAIDNRKKNLRYEIEFLDGGKRGTRENVPGVRLRGPWAGVAEFAELMANWERLDRVQLIDHEESAVSTVFDLLIPEDTAEWEWSPVRWMTRIHDRSALESVIGIPVDDLLAQAEWFDLDEDVILSPEGTLMIAEYACRIQPMPVLDWIVAEEKVYRESAKNGRLTTDLNKKPYTTSPEWEYHWYLEQGRPLHELLRSWCGQRAVTMQERLGAAEAEVHRLDQLIVGLLDEIERQAQSISVDYIARAHEEERITAANHRPVVDRPLKPAEVPVRYERAPRRWGH